ncbi:hypothetical protein LVJ94_33340 [Pendulispora rubella]|uniref:Porin n=1 Tax=Pendulispora rubella TaxID=2741070 RepID=A0ABZ2KSW5_9BACT
MSDRMRCRRWSASLIALGLILASARAEAQATTPEPAPAPTPPPAPEPPPTTDPATQQPAPAPISGATPLTSAPAPVPPAPAPSPPAAAPPTPPEPEPVHYPIVGPNRELRLSENVALRLGVQAQIWADSSQDPNREPDGGTGDHQNNFILRRGRILAGANLMKNMTLYVLLESSALGMATGTTQGNNKNFSPPQILDAWGEVKFHDAFMLEGGLMIVPVSRNHVMATTTYLSLDTGNTTAVTLGALQTSVLRDVGFQAKGQLFGDHFEYRLGVFSGIREAPHGTPQVEVGAQNSPRFSGYLQYNFLDPEKGYVFHGTYYGRKKVLGISSGFDLQKGSGLDPYYAVSGAAFTAIPLNGDAKAGGDEIASFVNYTYYDGQETARTLNGQNDLLIEAAYFNKASSLSVFGKFEGQFFGRDDTQVANRIWYGGGLKYHLYENYCNFTLAFNHSTFPNAPTSGDGAKNSTNQYTFAMQLYYF